MSTLLQQAIDLAKTGDRKAAEKLLRQVLAEQPDNEIAWIWLSGVTPDVNVKQQALQRALQLNPNNQLAQKGLTRFGGQPAAPDFDSSLIEEAQPSPPPAEPGPSEPSDPVFDFDFDVDQPEPPSAPAEPGEGEPSAPVFDFDFDIDQPEPPSAPAEPEPGEPSAPTFDFDFDIDQPEPPSAPAEPGEGEPSAPVFDFDFIDETPPTAAPGEPEQEEASPFEFDFMADQAQPEIAPASEGFDLDESPPFDFGADSDAGPAEPAPVEPAESESPAFDFDFGAPPPFATDQTETETADTEEGFDWGGLADFSAPAEAAEAPPEVPLEQPPVAPEEEVEEPAKPTEAEISLEEPEEEVEEELSEEDLRAKMIQRQKRQQRMLIIGTVLFTIMVITCCSLYYYVDEVVGLYNAAPFLAGPELKVKAGKSKDGISILKFKGYPATKAKIEWTPDNSAATCSGSTGLAVDFMNDDDPLRISNRGCSGDPCGLERSITPSAINDVKVTYKCGSNAVITLYK